MQITQTPYIKKTITHILKSPPIKRGFFSITNVLPPESKKPYNYVTPEHITLGDHAVLDNFYRATEKFRDKPHLTEDDINDELDDNKCLRKLTKSLQKNNPDFIVNSLGVILRSEYATSLHNDRSAKEIHKAELVVIVPIYPQDKQTLFLDNHGIFKESRINKNFYSVKYGQKDAFLDELSNAQKNIPKDAIASLFYIDDKNGDPVIHCGPFDTTNTSITDSIANFIPINTDEFDKTRCFAVWTIRHKNDTKTDDF